jgi:hypothetical protein
MEPIDGDPDHIDSRCDSDRLILEEKAGRGHFSTSPKSLIWFNLQKPVKCLGYLINGAPLHVQWNSSPLKRSFFDRHL